MNQLYEVVPVSEFPAKMYGDEVVTFINQDGYFHSWQHFNNNSEFNLYDYTHYLRPCKEKMYSREEMEGFAEWAERNYALVNSDNDSKWVNKEHGILVNGSKEHYAKLIRLYGVTTKALLDIFQSLPSSTK